MPNGGKPRFETANIILDEAHARADPEVHTGPYVMIAVSDTATGRTTRPASPDPCRLFLELF
jgi:hypothetical protein